MKLLPFLLGCLFALTTAGAADAQLDHYKCFKAKDTAKVFKKASADLTTLQAEFPSENCALKKKAKKVCIPASKQVLSIVEGTDVPFPAQDLSDAQLCYKIKCPKVAIAPLEVTDQLGTRNIEKFKASTLCVPAVIN